MTDLVERLRKGARRMDRNRADNDAAQAALNKEAADRIAALEARVRGLEGALGDMVGAVCGEDGFAACVRLDSGYAYPWEALDIAEARARAALKATAHPAQEKADR